MDTWGSARKDVVERACGNCGTRFRFEDPACPNCFRPVTAAYSRWRGGPTSLGLSAKLALVGTLVALAIGNAVYWVSSLGSLGLPRALEISGILLLPIPFLFRRTRIR